MLHEKGIVTFSFHIFIQSETTKRSYSPNNKTAIIFVFIYEKLVRIIIRAK